MLKKSVKCWASGYCINDLNPVVYTKCQNMHFGARLSIERKKLQLSASDLALLCGVSRSYITLIETGKRLPGKRIIPKIAEALKLKTNIIVNWYLEELREKIK